ncbi:hypothetical protein D5S17_13820 [Pseudonocardiaceae bacterium YIM PH 21723]|nr:hypothetical protein D5S17_13820 [Pseudonocardiaceae bacterium YIM PH 21723]
MTHWTPGWDMHRPGSADPLPADRLPPIGALVAGEVVCHHAFGLGLYLMDFATYGHVNLPEIPGEFPAIGSAVTGIFLDISGNRQLRLSLRWVHRTLAGLRLTDVGRSANIAWLHIGGYALHVQAPLRLVRSGQILLGSDDMLWPQERGAEDSFDAFTTMYDRNAELLNGFLGRDEFLVLDGEIRPAGHLVLRLTDELVIEVLPARAGEGEAWRLFERGPGGYHHVHPPEEGP